MLLASTAALFNLVCTGTQFIGGPADIWAGKNKTPYSVEYRIDLKAERWCFGNCASTRPIHRVDSTQIVFEMSEDSTGDNLVVVNRESGAFLDRQRFLGAEGYTSMRYGTCVRAPFKGFPARRF